MSTSTDHLIDIMCLDWEFKEVENKFISMSSKLEQIRFLSCLACPFSVLSHLQLQKTTFFIEEGWQDEKGQNPHVRNSFSFPQ